MVEKGRETESRENALTKFVIMIVGGLFVGIMLLIIFFSAVVTVPAGFVGIKYDSLQGGVQLKEPLGEGIHIIAPIFSSVYMMDTRTIKVEYPASAASRDLQIVNSKVAVSYHVTKGSAPILYQQVGIDFSDKIISPAIQEKFKAGTARFNAEELIQRREDVKAVIYEGLSDTLKKYDVLLDEVSITDFDFSPEFNAAIEQKVVAQQQKQKAENDLERIRVEAAQTIVQANASAQARMLDANASAMAKILDANATAEALRMQREQVTPELIRLRQIERWDGRLPMYMMGDAMPLIDVTSAKSTD